MPAYRPAQCLEYGLKHWHQQGGYLVLRKSEHWSIPHVMHLAHDGTLTHFVPHADLEAPWYSVFGFEGIVRTGDTAPAPSMPMRGMLMGSLILLVLGGWWVAKWKIGSAWTTAKWRVRPLRLRHILALGALLGIVAALALAESAP